MKHINKYVAEKYFVSKIQNAFVYVRDIIQKYNFERLLDYHIGLYYIAFELNGIKIASCEFFFMNYRRKIILDFVSNALKKICLSF